MFKDAIRSRHRGAAADLTLYRDQVGEPREIDLCSFRVVKFHLAWTSSCGRDEESGIFWFIVPLLTNAQHAV